MKDELAKTFEIALRAANRSKGTIAQRLGDLERFERTTGVDVSVATAEILKRYLAEGIDNGWKPEYAKRIRSSMRVWFAWLHAEGIRNDNPALTLPSIRVPRTSQTKPVTKESVVRAAYTDAPTTAIRLALALGAVLGLRRTEIATLRLSDRDGHTLHVTGKGGITRLLDLDDSTLRLLIDREAEVHYGEFYFPGRFYGHIHPSTIYRWLRPLTGTGLHALRRRAGTNAHNKVGDLRAVQVFLGHASLDTTQRYVDWYRPNLRRIAEANALGVSLQPTLLDDEAELLTAARELSKQLMVYGWRLQVVPC